MADCTYPKCQQTAIPGCQGLCRDLSVNRSATDEQRAGVPEGWKLVPLVPTTGMVCAAVGVVTSQQAREAYAAMLAAAPTPPAGDAGPFAGVSKVERESDFSVRLTFDSCRQASAFDRAAMAAMADSKGDAA